MSVKLRLKRMGRANQPFYRLSAIDSRSPRDGRVIEELGHYNPLEKDKAKQFVAKIDRCKHWLDIGAVPSATVSTLLKKSGVEHKQLRIRRFVKPKPAPVAAAVATEEKKAEAPIAEAPTAQTPTAEAPTAGAPAAGAPAAGAPAAGAPAAGAPAA